MRSMIILSGVALLSLAAASAQAQTSGSPSASPAPAASTSPRGDRGYDSRAKTQKPPKAERSGSVAPGFAQTSTHHPGNNAGYLVPFGPPS